MEPSPLRLDQTDDDALVEKLDADADRMAVHTRWIMLATVALLLVGGLAAVIRSGSGSNEPAAPKGNVLVGTVDLVASINYNLSGGSPTWCSSKTYGSGSGYSDLKEGAQVLVLDGAGTTIGTGTLGAGHRAPDSTSKCTFDFAVAGVPKADFYSVKVSHRGGPTYSFADLQSRGWKVDLTIG